VCELTSLSFHDLSASWAPGLARGSDQREEQARGADVHEDLRPNLHPGRRR
jgi:hypothetical protein